MNRRAFTLVELLVVISIIGLLSTIAITQMSSSREKARIARGLSYEGSVYRAVGDDVVSQWDFNDCSGTSASDSSNAGNTGTLSAGASWSTNTPTGSGCALSLNGTSGLVTIPYLNTITTSLVYSAWFNSSSATTRTILASRATLLRVSATGIDWWADVNTNPMSIAKNISLNVWHHIVVDQNGTAYAIYLDGGLVGSGTAPAINNASAYNAIGYDNYSGGIIWTGLLDNIRVYRRSLTAREIWRLYADEAPQHGVVLIATKGF